MTIRAITTLCLAIGLGTTGMAAAVAAPPLTVSSELLVEKRVAAADGTTRIMLVPPTRVVPGDRVVFSLRYRNTGTQPIANVVLANPVPAGVAYRAPGNGSPAPDVSVDGRTFGPLAALRMPASGARTRAATADDVTSVRWQLPQPIAPGGQGQLTFQAVLR